jgi:uncharacterized protein
MTVADTEEAAHLLCRLTGRHGPLMFHQPVPCWHGSSPVCHAPGELLTGDADIRLGDVQIAGVSDSIPVWMSVSQFEYGKHTR